MSEGPVPLGGSAGQGEPQPLASAGSGFDSKEEESALVRALGEVRRALSLQPAGQDAALLARVLRNAADEVGALSQPAEGSAELPTNAIEMLCEALRDLEPRLDRGISPAAAGLSGASGRASSVDSEPPMLRVAGGGVAMHFNISSWYQPARKGVAPVKPSQSPRQSPRPPRLLLAPRRCWPDEVDGAVEPTESTGERDSAAQPSAGVHAPAAADESHSHVSAASAPAEASAQTVEWEDASPASSSTGAQAGMDAQADAGAQAVAWADASMQTDYQTNGVFEPAEDDPINTADAPDSFDDDEGEDAEDADEEEEREERGEPKAKAGKSWADVVGRSHFAIPLGGIQRPRKSTAELKASQLARESAAEHRAKLGRLAERSKIAAASLHKTANLKVGEIVFINEQSEIERSQGQRRRKAEAEARLHTLAVEAQRRLGAHGRRASAAGEAQRKAQEEERRMEEARRRQRELSEARQREL
ncbi:hypothetical protein T492DRAFT_867572, partial [Pavlovales sp. CCMP2436]